MKIKHTEPYGPLRAKAYPHIGDQLDAVLKLAQALQAQGFTLPAEVIQWIDACTTVKNKFAKK